VAIQDLWLVAELQLQTAADDVAAIVKPGQGVMEMPGLGYATSPIWDLASSFQKLL